MKSKITAGILILTLALAGASFTGCSKAQSGAAIGAGAGALGGAIIGHQSGHRTEGALIGGAVGAAGGYAVGNEMDKNDQNYQYNEPRPRYDYRDDRY
ncbi:glycine zipper 2TM domain-containing protein [Candidatus Sumerlaeota bacterium]|nr:glycine zipper 2TM domain-containing protein [Candidatus Sumerlaeota bacterium]